MTSRPRAPAPAVLCEFETGHHIPALEYILCSKAPLQMAAACSQRAQSGGDLDRASVHSSKTSLHANDTPYVAPISLTL